MSDYFIHFGCWNNGGCPEENALTKVTDAVKQLKPKFLSICGDNYYPIKNKTDKKHIFERRQFESGFECLPKNIPIYMTYGNHDFETGLVTGDTVENDCMLTSLETDLKIPNIHLKLFQSVQFTKNTLVIFLDTTIYDNEEIDEYIECYKKVDPALPNVEQVKRAQSRFIDETVKHITHDVTNIIIVGHHPIAQYKYKKEQMRYMVLSDLADFIYTHIFEKLGSEKNYYYLCADLHQYQKGTVTIRDTMKIHQYIVGTGGAKKDPLMKELIPTVKSLMTTISLVIL